MAEQKRVGIREFRSNFAGFMRQVRQGASFVVTSRDQIVALIQPTLSPPTRPRQPGTLRGQIHAAADFDDVPPDILAAMEADGV